MMSWDSRSRKFTSQKHLYDLNALAAAMKMLKTVARSKIHDKKFAASLMSMADVGRTLWTKTEMAAVHQVMNGKTGTTTKTGLHTIRNKLCFEFMKRKSSPAKPWTKEEDKNLQSFVAKFQEGNKSWTFVDVGILMNRPGKHCYNRWHNSASPNLCSTKATSHEMEVIYMNFCKHGS